MAGLADSAVAFLRAVGFFEAGASLSDESGSSSLLVLLLTSLDSPSLPSSLPVCFPFAVWDAGVVVPFCRVDLLRPFGFAPMPTKEALVKELSRLAPRKLCGRSSDSRRKGV